MSQEDLSSAYSPPATTPATPPGRRRAAAVLASLLVASGAGHLAVGDRARALGWYALEVLLMVALVPVMLGGNVPLVVGWMLAALLVRPASAFAAVLRSRPPRPRPSWLVVVPIWVAMLIAGQFVGTNPASRVRSFSMPSGAMMPTLLIGDRFITDAAPGQPLRRGDIVVFHYQKANVDYLKRIVGLPGDQVEFQRGDLIVNGKVVERTSTGRTFTEDAPVPAQVHLERQDGRSHEILLDPARIPATLAPITVPADSLFVLGDNRDNSFDSRVFGPIHVNTVKAVARWVYWSRDVNGAVRWQRIGARLQ